jgi:hypothetical protein
MRIAVYIHLIGWNSTNAAIAPDTLSGTWQVPLTFQLSHSLQVGLLHTTTRQNR